MPLKTVFATKDKDGNDLSLAIETPSAKVRQQAQLVYGRAYREGVEANLLIKEQLDKYLRKSNLWDDDAQKEYDRLRKAVSEGETKLEKGGNAGLTKKGGRDLAIQISKDRAALRDLLMVRSHIEENTADHFAEQARFNYLVAATTVYNEGPLEGRPVFTRDNLTPSVDAYIERGGEAVAIQAATKLSEVLYGDSAAIINDLPETRFLKKYGFIDDSLNFVDASGNKVDEKGRRIDEEGYLLDADGKRVDEEGNPLDADGRPIVEFAEFLDD